MNGKQLYSELSKRNTTNRQNTNAVEWYKLLCRQGDLFRLEHLGRDRAVSINELVYMVQNGCAFVNIDFLEPYLLGG